MIFKMGPSQLNKVSLWIAKDSLFGPAVGCAPPGK